MSTISAMPAEELLRTIERHLTPFVTVAEKGFLSIARDPLEIFEQLGQAPGRFRTILNWAGEQPAGHKDSGIVKHTFQVVVSHNRGLSVLKGLNLGTARADDKPLYALSGSVRDLLRSLRFPDEVTSTALEYGGTEPNAVDGTMIDAVTQTWTLIATLPPSAG